MKICSVSDCDMKMYALGYCVKHHAKFKKYGDPLVVIRKQHGLKGTKEYAAWNNMMTRCYNKKAGDYPYYGGRGIAVCQRWQDGVEDFIKDMGKKPEGLTLERIDVNGDYEPGNCTWVSHRQQMLNRRWPLPKTGARGIRFSHNRKRFEATASVMNKMNYIGSYETLQEAVDARAKYLLEVTV